MIHGAITCYTMCFGLFVDCLTHPTDSVSCCGLLRNSWTTAMGQGVVYGKNRVEDSEHNFSKLAEQGQA